MMAKCRVSFSFSLFFFCTFHIHPWWMSSKRLVESKEEENGQFFGLGDDFFPHWCALRPATGSDGHFFTFIVKPDRIHLLWFCFFFSRRNENSSSVFFFLLSSVFCPTYSVVFLFFIILFIQRTCHDRRLHFYWGVFVHSNRDKTFALTGRLFSSRLIAFSME